jgi:hypothetical protein
MGAFQLPSRCRSKLARPREGKPKLGAAQNTRVMEAKVSAR